VTAVALVKAAQAMAIASTTDVTTPIAAMVVQTTPDAPTTTVATMAVATMAAPVTVALAATTIVDFWQVKSNIIMFTYMKILV
jgi:hypothetical protein